MHKIPTLLFTVLFFSKGFSQCATTPTITSFAPASGPAGTLVTITGTNFDAVAVNNTVFFGNVKTTALAVTVTTLQVTVPTGALSQYLAVNKPCGATAMLQYGFKVTNPCAGSLVSGSYSSQVTYPAANRGYSAALGDLDGDGKLDMVVANYINSVSAFNPTSISVYRNLSTPGTVSFTDSTGYLVGSTQLYGVYIFDIDMDGKMDVIAQAPGAAISVFRNVSTTAGTILLAPRVDISMTGSWALTFGDIDGDSKPDIIWGGNNTASISRNLSIPGTISFAAAVTVTTQAPGFCNTTDVKVADLDGDGKNDIITAGYNCNAVGVVRNTSIPGSLSFDTYFTMPTSGQVYGVAVADLNNDGRPEIVAGNRSVSAINVYENQSTVGSLSAASFLTPINLPTGASTVMIEDITGDGKPDILSSNGGALTVFQNNYISGAIATSSFATARSWTLSCGGVPRMFDIGDVDGDGYIDAVSARDANLPTARAEIIRRIPSPGFSGLVAVNTLGITTNCNDNTWKYFYDVANTDKLLLAVKDNGLNLGTITAGVYTDANAGNYNAQPYMRRHYVINTANNPVGFKRVRLYYTAADFTNFQAAVVGLNTASQLSVTKYTGPGEDGVYDPQAGGFLTHIPKSAITTGTAFGQNYLEFDVTEFSEFWVHTGAFVLPLNQLTFDVKKCNDDVCLQWQTDNEQQVSRFEIERSFDGQHFNYVGTIAAKNQLHNNYGSTDKTGNQQNIFYRLKIINTDGDFKYSQVVRIRLDKKLDVTLSPNPVKDQLRITASAVIIKLQLINSVGQVIKTWQASHNDQYSLGSISNGIYTLKVFTQEQDETVKVLIYH
ncbi:MAG: FG-GAP-like repeat-containing protein [Ferruginibacter sp.]